MKASYALSHSSLPASAKSRVDLLVSFVMKSGLEQVHGGLVDALDRGATVRVTGSEGERLVVTAARPPEGAHPSGS